MKKILLLLVLLPGVVQAAQPADALNCTCVGGVTCANDSANNWTNCGGTAPDTNDTVSCSGVGTTLNLHGTAEVKNLSALPGCAVVCNNPGPMTLTFNSLISPALQFQEEFFVIDGHNGGAGSANPPSWTCDGKDVVIKWKGTGVTGATMILGAVSSQIVVDESNNVNIVLRGIKRVGTHVAAFSEGTATNFKDCIDGAVPPTGGAPGDTIVFTSGKSTDYWYQVSCYPDRCTGAASPFACCTGADATAECSATACNGGPCDLEITRNATTSSPGMVAGSRSWSSFAKIPGLGGPVRAATPDDADANGTADPAGTRPALGDAYEVFLPIRIQGGEKPIAGNGGTDTGGGILLFIGGVNLDTRYVEVAKLSGQNTESCTPGVNGPATIWTMIDKIISPEGDWGFWNVHDWASAQGGMEIGATKHIGDNDTRPNYPVTFRHWYFHDSDREISTVPCTRDSLGSGAGIVVDGTNDIADGYTFDGWHCARLHTGSCFYVSGSATIVPHKNIVLRHWIAHDIPQVLAYALNGNQSVLSFQAGQGLLEGYASWDLGGESNPFHALEAFGVDDNGTAVDFKAYNVFAVNADTNTQGCVHDAPAGVDFHASSDASANTAGLVLSNSYLTNFVGSAGYAGTWNFNFVKDVDLNDSGWPCRALYRRAILINPAAATGNVFTRSSSVACNQFGIYIAGYFGGSDFTAQTRRIVSNVFHNLDWTRTDDDCAALMLQSEGQNITRDVDFFNNVIDVNGQNCGSNHNFGILAAGGGVANTTRIYYNIIGGMSAVGSFGAGMLFESGTYSEDYNRCINNVGPCDAGGNGPHDVDSDVTDIYFDAANLLYGQRCDSPSLNPYGGPIGPIAYGIRNFDWFHPAVIPLMDPDAFIRYDWHECSGRSRMHRR